MLNIKKAKELFWKLVEKKLFPDFDNKLTWAVLVIGVILLTPVSLKQVFWNWLIDTINLNLNGRFRLAKIEADSTNYIWGLFLIFLALVHNIIAKKYFPYKTTLLNEKNANILSEVDKNLFLQFLKEFPSDSNTVIFLKEHDFNNSYLINNFQLLEIFVQSWNNAQREFIDKELESKRSELWAKCHAFEMQLIENSHPVNTGLLSCIPENYRNEWTDKSESVKQVINELNRMATECYKLHQDFVRLGRVKLAM